MYLSYYIREALIKKKNTHPYSNVAQCFYLTVET